MWECYALEAVSCVEYTLDEEHNTEKEKKEILCTNNKMKKTLKNINKDWQSGCI